MLGWLGFEILVSDRKFRM